MDESVLRRFWAKVHKTDTCWLWTGALDDGYGLLKVAGVALKAHRFSYELHFESIPEGLVIDHLCHNGSGCIGVGRECLHRRCVNPEHLEVVTRLENIQRGRNAQREQTHCIHGHEFTPDNTYRWRNHRACRTCLRANSLAHYYRRQITD